MKPAAKPALGDTQTIHMLPRWVTSVSSQDTDSVAFTSGAALAMLDVVLRDPAGTLPSALLRDRMAVEAAVACLKLENRHESMSDIRDAVCLARAGDSLGPAGDMFMAWRKLARINLIQSGWADRVVKLLPGPVAEVMPELGSFVRSPVNQAAQVLAVVLQKFPRQEAAALILTDVALARAIGWERPMPLLAAQLTRKDIRAISNDEIDPVLCVHHAMVGGCDSVIRRAVDLSRRASKLSAVAPKNMKMRAKSPVISARPNNTSYP